MRYYFLRLTLPRPTFNTDCSPEELRLLQDHAFYWSGLVSKGIAVVFGPVVEPAEVYGICVLRLNGEMNPRVIADGDPAIKADAGFDFEIFPMQGAGHFAYYG